MRYAWQRFWYEPQDTVFVDEEAGYLLDYEDLSDRGSKALPYRAIAQCPCLILLGDAGSGKSVALEEASRSEVQSPDEAPLRVDLKDLREDGIRRYLFDHYAWL